jgi:hypothetical protein
MPYLLTFRKLDTNIVTKVKKQNDEQPSDLLIWILACFLMTGIMFISVVTQAR